MAGCGSGGREQPASTSDSTAATAIRKVDFDKLPDVQTMARQFAPATVDGPAIIYADLTGDQREEAIVPFESGGTLGNVAYQVFTERSGRPALILVRTLDSESGLKMAVEGGRLVETRAEFGAEDPFCCPSMMRRTTFRWDGSRLQVEREEQVDNPAGAKQ